MINFFKKRGSKAFINDFFFKIIANFVSVIIRNVIVLPLLARIFLSSEYGEIVTIIGIVSTIASALGNALLSTRLVLEKEYIDESITGDFNALILIVSAISALFSLPLILYFPSLSFGLFFFVFGFLFLETFLAYHSGWFLLKQEYRKLLVYTLLGGVGFVLGILLTLLTDIWVLTYLASDVCCLFFILFFSPLLKESFSFTYKIKKVLSKYAILIVATLIASSISYMDRLMLYPILGSEAVSIYTSASVFGKAFNLLALPVSSIMLGYYSTGKIRLNLKKYWIINFATLAILALFILCTLIFGKFVTGILYPSLINSALPYILIANASSAIAASAQITKSAALKYAKTYWTLIINAIYGVTYFVLGYILVKKEGLSGFANAVLIVNIIQIIILYIVCSLTFLFKKNRKEAQEWKK